MGRRIAIIGAGPAALAAAYRLALQGSPDDTITLYQVGWRIGGKCASGRNVVTGRVHEHGLHVFAGFYHESLQELRNIYRTWQEVGSSPIPFSQALRPVNGCLLAEPGHRAIPISLAPSDRSPDSEHASIEGLDLMMALIEVVFGEFIKRSQYLPAPLRRPFETLEARHGFLLREAVRLLRRSMARPAGGKSCPVSRIAARALALLLRPFRDALTLFVALEIGDQQARDQATLATLAAVVAIGLLDDDMLPDNFDCVSDMEATDWLRRHGASQTVLDSAYVRGGYDYPFAYGGGQTNPERRRIAAGTAIRGYLNLVLTFQGSIFYHFNRATAEVLFTPYYEVLRALGVRFAFFHRIEGIELDASGARIEHIVGTRQARPLAGSLDYNPLIDHAGHQCWPDEPKFDLLEDGERLRLWLAEQRIDLEADGFPADCPLAEPFALTRGVDGDDGFTHVLLTVPPRVVERIAAPLIAANPMWRAAVASASQIPTIAVELRGVDPAPGDPSNRPILTANTQPFGTWADMSFIREDQAAGADAHLSYLCGAWPDRRPAPGEAWADFVEREYEKAHALTDAWLKQNLERTLRLGLGRPVGPIPIIDNVKIRLNLSASEGYVLSPPGSITKRLEPGRPYFENLYVAGDWTRTGIDAGCYEAALISGQRVAKAIHAAARG